MDLSEQLQEQIDNIAPASPELQHIRVPFRFFEPTGVHTVPLLVLRRTVQTLVHMAGSGDFTEWVLSPMTEERWAIFGGHPMYFDPIPVAPDGVVHLPNQSRIVNQFQHRLSIKRGTFNAGLDFHCTAIAHCLPLNRGPSVLLGAYYLHFMWKNLDETGKDFRILPLMPPAGQDENRVKIALAAASAKQVLASIWGSLCGWQLDNTTYWNPAWHWVIAKSSRDLVTPTGESISTYIVSGPAWSFLRAHVHTWAQRRDPRRPVPPIPRIEWANLSGFEGTRHTVQTQDVIDSVEPPFQQGIVNRQVADSWIYIQFKHEYFNNTALARVTLLPKSGGRLDRRPPLADFYLVFKPFPVQPPPIQPHPAHPSPEQPQEHQAQVQPHPAQPLPSRSQEPGFKSSSEPTDIKVKVEKMDQEARQTLSKVPELKTEETVPNLKRESPPGSPQAGPSNYYDLATRHQLHSITSRLRHLDLASDFDVSAPEAKMSRRQKAVYGVDAAEGFRRRW